MTRNSFILAFALSLAALSVPAVTRADPSDARKAEALMSEADNAGSAAGVVNQCHDDSAPIRAAFERALDQAGVSDAVRESLWQRYRASEVSTIEALANGSDAGCADTADLIQHTVHRLEMPVS